MKSNCTGPIKWGASPDADASDEEVLEYLDHLEACDYHAELEKRELSCFVNSLKIAKSLSPDGKLGFSEEDEKRDRALLRSYEEWKNNGGEIDGLSFRIRGVEAGYWEAGKSQSLIFRRRNRFHFSVGLEDSHLQIFAADKMNGAECLLATYVIGGEGGKKQSETILLGAHQLTIKEEEAKNGRIKLVVGYQSLRTPAFSSTAYLMRALRQNRIDGYAPPRKTRKKGWEIGFGGAFSTFREVWSMTGPKYKYAILIAFALSITASYLQIQSNVSLGNLMSLGIPGENKSEAKKDALSTAKLDSSGLFGRAQNTSKANEENISGTRKPHNPLKHEIQENANKEPLTPPSTPQPKEALLFPGENYLGTLYIDKMRFVGDSGMGRRLTRPELFHGYRQLKKSDGSSEGYYLIVNEPKMAEFRLDLVAQIIGSTLIIKMDVKDQVSGQTAVVKNVPPLRISLEKVADQQQLDSEVEQVIRAKLDETMFE